MNKILRSFHFLSFSLLLFASLILFFDVLPEGLFLLLKDVTIGFIFITMMFAVYFSRSKLFVLLFLPLFYMLYMFYPSLLGLDGGFYSFWYLFPLSITVSFILLSFLSERGLFCFYGVLKVALLLTILAISYYYIATFSIDFRHSLDTAIITYDLKPLIKTNDFTFILSVCSIIIVTLNAFIFFTNTIDRSLFWILYALLIPALFFQSQSAFILFATLSAILTLIALLRDTYHMAYVDTLTQIPARRALEESFLRLGRNYSIAMVDIDFFKKFNDTYGHDIGDEVLKLVAAQLQEVKGGGKAFRYGGEEFTILFSSHDRQKVIPLLEEVREGIAKRAFTLRDKDRPEEKPKKKQKRKDAKKVHLSVSIGVAFSPKDGQSPQEVIKAADEALYKAKQSGRNCVMST